MKTEREIFNEVLNCLVSFVNEYIDNNIDIDDPDVIEKTTEIIDIIRKNETSK